MNKKIFALLLCVTLLCMLAVPAAAASAPVITLQPQSYHYPEYSVAVYTVEATGEHLTATWYLKYEGKTYTLSDNTNAAEPWEGYAGENYGPMEEGPNTFSWFFGGIEAGLNGAEIWCVLEDGHYDVESAHAVITVQGSVLPPQILKLPTALTAKRGEEAELRCVAKSNSEAQLAFQWYETATGKLPDIRAIDGEDGDYIFLNTETAGTRYYVCCVTSTDGGMVYSSVVPVTVTDGTPAGDIPTFLTKSLPKGYVGEDYGFILETDQHDAVFTVSYNPGGANDFEKTGLSLSMEGMLMGKLTKAGTYTFTVCVSNDYGEDYGVLTLEVAEAPAVEPTTDAPSEDPTTATDTAPSEDPTTATDTAPSQPDSQPTESAPGEAPTQPQSPVQTPEAAEGFPWWGYLLIALVAAGAGIGVAILLVKKKS